MGIFPVGTEVGGLNGKENVSVAALVRHWLPVHCAGSRSAGNLGHRTHGATTVSIGDDTLVEYDIGEARLSLEGRRRVTPVVLAPQVSVRYWEQ